MKYVAIDVGTYSIKFITSNVDKKKVYHQSLTEIVIDQFIDQYRGEIDLNHVELEIIQQYLNEQAPEGKIISQVPDHLISTRFLILPIKNKKKARQTIPFQIDEEIPYSTTDIHLTSILRTHGDATLAFIAFSEKQRFDGYYNNLFAANLVPDIMTIEASPYQAYIQHHNINTPICIVNIGHSTTKAFFFNNQNLVSCHKSHIAGKQINEVIASTYKISQEEATIYKHQNGFMLTSEQYEEVDSSQKEFAQLMDRIFAPLVSEIKRWEIGYRVKFGTKIQNVLITGGTSNLTNLHNYFTEELGIRAQRLKAFENIITINAEEDADTKKENVFSLANLMVVNTIHKNILLNFKSGVAFAGSESNTVPLHSISHITIRAIVIMLIIACSLFTERLVLNSHLNSLNKKISRILKTPSMHVSKRHQRQFRKKPNKKNTNKIFSIIQKHDRSIQKEIDIIEAASSVNAIASLTHLSRLLKLTDTIAMIKYHSENGQIKATFKSKKFDEMRALEQQLESMDLKDLDRKLNNTKDVLNISFRE